MLCEMPPPLRLRLQTCAFFGEDLGDALGWEADLQKPDARVRDVAMFDDLAVSERHDRNAIEAYALAFRFGQSRNIAESVIGIYRPPVAHRTEHLPAEVARGPVVPVVDHLRD